MGRIEHHRRFKPGTRQAEIEQVQQRTVAKAVDAEKSPILASNTTSKAIG
jgi:hypothetical protein